MKNDLRILFLGEVHEKWGGDEVWTFNLLRELKKYNLNIIPLYTYTRSTNSSIKSYTLRALGVVGVVRKIMKAKDFDLIHTSKIFFPLVALLFSRRRPVVATIHDVYGAYFNIKDKGLLTGFLRFLVEVISIKIPTMIIVPSISTKYKIEAFGIPSNRIRFVGAGVNLNLIDSVNAEKSSDPEIIFVGRLVRHKHPEIVVKLSADLRARANIIGEGPLEGMLKELASKLGANVVFYGRISEIDKIRILKRSWILVLPSEMEGFGLVLAEALACNTPVIAFDCGGPRDIVVDGVNGFLVPVGNYKLLYERAKILIEKQELRYEMGIKGRYSIESKFKWCDVAKRTISTYLEALKKFNSIKF